MGDPRLTKIVSEQPYPLIFATISGAHLYGFPSPDSDYDLRGVHVLPVRDVVGLNEPRETIEVSGMHDGLEMDLVQRGMGMRSARYSMLVVDGEVKTLNVEQPGKFEVSDAETLLKQAEKVTQFMP